LLKKAFLSFALFLTIKSKLKKLYFCFSAGAMQAMVSKGIVHRDLKPQNILLSHDGRTKNPQPQDITLKIGEIMNAYDNARKQFIPNVWSNYFMKMPNNRQK
jgi:serine/threonine protein kinase